MHLVLSDDFTDLVESLAYGLGGSSRGRLLVLGAGGGAGRVLVPRALAAEHSVTVVVRDRQRLRLQHSELAVVEGSVMDAAVMNEALLGQEAVVSVLGTRRGPSGFGSFKLMSRTMAALLPAMQRHRVQRLVLLSALRVGESAALSPLILRIVFQTAFRPVGRDKALSEDQLRRSGLDSTVVYAPELANVPGGRG